MECQRAAEGSSREDGAPADRGAVAPGTVRRALSAAGEVWSEAKWTAYTADTARRAMAAGDDGAAWRIVVSRARGIMRAYTTGFFLVSRFLPRAKRDRVEAIYSAVRYPDEVVDSFPLSPEERLSRLDAWASAYERALTSKGLREAVADGVAPFLAAFAHVVREARIPPEHYRAFLDAMRRDVRPASFRDPDDLADRYVHGSAVVVGYFLAHVYGAATPGDLERALRASRALGIGLQLTNFLRDVREDRRRGRLYLPLSELAAEGLDERRVDDPAAAPALVRVIRNVARRAEAFYAEAARDLDAFAPDSRIAIRACIDIYGALNRRILESPDPLAGRESVPLREKWRVLPPSKWWRIPMAYVIR